MTQMSAFSPHDSTRLAAAVAVTASAAAQTRAATAYSTNDIRKMTLMSSYLPDGRPWLADDVAASAAAQTQTQIRTQAKTPLTINDIVRVRKDMIVALREYALTHKTFAADSEQYKQARSNYLEKAQDYSMLEMIRRHERGRVYYGRPRTSIYTAIRDNAAPYMSKCMDIAKKIVKMTQYYPYGSCREIVELCDEFAKIPRTHYGYIRDLVKDMTRQAGSYWSIWDLIDFTYAFVGM
jgi:hypothetical protein